MSTLFSNKDLICPRCHKQEFDTLIDGGSQCCKECRIVFHKCAGGDIKYGSPGPDMCDVCRPNTTTVLRQSVSSK